jgi:hypothetical protein
MLTSDAYPYREEHGPVDDISRLPTLELSPSAATHAVGFLGVSNMHKSQLSGLRLKAQPFNHSCPQDLMGRGGVFGASRYLSRWCIWWYMLWGCVILSY